jgi:outer membrane protein OmpA-like peptidoglycan-associated protein
MMRWIWAALAAFVVIAIGLFFWQSSDRGTVTTPVAQAPPVAPAAPTVAQAPPTPAAAATGEKEAAAPPTAPAAAQNPGASAADPTGEKEPAVPPAAQTAAQAPATNAPAPASEREPPPATVAQAPEATAAAPTSEKESSAAPSASAAAQVPATDAAPPTAAKEPTPATPTVAQTPATNEAAPTGEKESAAKPNETRSEINAKATAELASLKPGFGPKELIAALNRSEINFRSDSAEVPASAMAFLQTAAEDLKQMPPGNVLEIAGYTDNTGEAALNVALSQKRADAVRDALVKSGANADMLVAKGYGSADPVASNDTPEGRLRNRRIEYRLMKAP